MAVETQTPVYMQDPRRQGRGFTQNQLNAWLDEQAGVSYFMLKISTTVELRHIADGKKLSFYQTIGSSPWLETVTASHN